MTVDGRVGSGTGHRQGGQGGVRAGAGAGHRGARPGLCQRRVQGAAGRVGAPQPGCHLAERAPRRHQPPAGHHLLHRQPGGRPEQVRGTGRWDHSSLCSQVIVDVADAAAACSRRWSCR